MRASINLAAILSLAALMLGLDVQSIVVMPAVAWVYLNFLELSLSDSRYYYWSDL